MPDITITSLQGHEFGAYCAAPESGNGPGLIVVQEIFGVNANMRKLCDDFAAQGYIAVCPDLFWRQQPGIQLTDKTPAEWERAFELYQGFDVEAGLCDLLLTLGHIRKMEGCNGKVGTVGYCLGGKLAYLLATRSDVDVAVSYYGVELDKYLGEVPEIRMPLLLHIAGLDKYVPPDSRAKILKSIARNPVITAHVYENADHAFARIAGQNYDREAAELAQKRTLEFLADSLMS
jgi:carboxymethylenebutenolidase